MKSMSNCIRTLVMQTIFTSVKCQCVCVCVHMFLGVPLNTKLFWSLVHPKVPQPSCCYGDASNLTLFFLSSVQTSHRSEQIISLLLPTQTHRQHVLFIFVSITLKYLSSQSAAKCMKVMFCIKVMKKKTPQLCEIVMHDFCHSKE